MYVRVVEVKVRPGTWHEYYDAIVKYAVAGRKIASGRIEYWVVRTDEDEGFVFHVWDSEEAFHRYHESEYHRGEREKRAEKYLVGEYPTTDGEVWYIDRGSNATSYIRSRW